ncbi:hypothetical protein [Moraxella lacunata]|uniref:hypothetical protein n=1 Tax=Moraxella lacunata TaxID=477 RepID=UPI003EE0C6D3
MTENRYDSTSSPRTVFFNWSFAGSLFKKPLNNRQDWSFMPFLTFGFGLLILPHQR